MTSGNTESNSEIIAKYGANDKDTGKTEVQVALLTSKIKKLTEHFAKFPKDKHSKRGMMTIISKRKSLLNYLKNESVDRYTSLITSLGLRK